MPSSLSSEPSSTDFASRQARRDLERLHKDISALEALGGSPGATNGAHLVPDDVELRIRLANVSSSNAAVLNTINQLTPLGVSPNRQLLRSLSTRSAEVASTDATLRCHDSPSSRADFALGVGGTTFKPRPPPRRVLLDASASMGSGGVGSGFFRRTETILPPVPAIAGASPRESRSFSSNVEGALASHTSTNPPGFDVGRGSGAAMGSALAAVRTRGQGLSQGRCNLVPSNPSCIASRPWEHAPSPLKSFSGPPSVTIRVRGAGGRVNTIARKFYPLDTVATVVHEYLREYQASITTVMDARFIQLFVPLMPPIPYEVMARVTLKEAKMCPASTVTLQLTP